MGGLENDCVVPMRWGVITIAGGPKRWGELCEVTLYTSPRGEGIGERIGWRIGD